MTSIYIYNWYSNWSTDRLINQWTLRSTIGSGLQMQMLVSGLHCAPESRTKTWLVGPYSFFFCPMRNNGFLWCVLNRKDNKDMCLVFKDDSRMTLRIWQIFSQLFIAYFGYFSFGDDGINADLICKLPDRCSWDQTRKEDRFRIWVLHDSQCHMRLPPFPSGQCRCTLDDFLHCDSFMKFIEVSIW